MGKLLDSLDTAAAAVVLQTKPIRHLNVTPFNDMIHKLCVSRQRVFGCHTQIRMRDLARDGYHVAPYCMDVIDKTYACAILGKPVPCPTPDEDFSHHEQTVEYRKNFPRLGGADKRGQDSDRNAIHGWRW